MKATTLTRLRLGLAVGLLLAPALRAELPPPVTHVFKRTGNLEIKADVHQPVSDTGARPVVVYIHGGSLINGKRESVQNWSPAAALVAAGVVVISIDYRLAPETKLPAIIEDLEDAFRWVREQGPALFHADPARIGVAGGSAGGYLALVAGYRVQPRPRVVFAEMSYGDLIGEWQRRPSIHPPHYVDSNLDEANAWRQVSGPPIANAQDRNGDGGAFNDFIRRNARWPKTISGWDPRTEQEKFVPYLPVRNVTPDYPPAFLLHGAADTDVVPEQPRLMAAEFARHGVEHQLVFLPNGEHGFRGADPDLVEAARREAVDFVLKRLTADPSGATMPPVTTYTFKRVGALEIKAEVNQAKSDGRPAPVVVWIHGGGLMGGERQRDSADERQLVDLLLADGITVVSIDYRLAPETKLPSIVEDVEDAFRWVRERGPELFGADPDRIGVVGTSAGGFLTLVAGHRVRPRPVALVSFWGYGEIIGPWFSQPSTRARHNLSKVTESDARRFVSGAPVANAADRAGSSGAFYQYCRQNGLWPEAVSGWNPTTEKANFIPYMPLENVTPDYPPTLLIHGETDTDVPKEESVMMAAALKQNGVEHRLIIVPGAEHGLKGSDPTVIKAMEQAAADFLRLHLKTRTNSR